MQRNDTFFNAQSREKMRRAGNRLKASWNQLVYELKTPAQYSGYAQLGATEEDWAAMRNARSEAYRLQALWLPFMGTRPYTIGTAPYSGRKNPSDGQLLARKNYFQGFADKFNIVYKAIFEDWGLRFADYDAQEQLYKVLEMEYRVALREGREPPESLVNLPGVNIDHDQPVGPLHDEGLDKYSNGGNGNGEGYEKYMKYLPAVGVGLAAFRLFFK